MIVVADTSPVNYLVLIHKVDLLPQLYRRILIPPAVVAELKHQLTPKTVRDWVFDPPGWLEVLKPQSTAVSARLDPGESEAIALAVETQADLLLIDEQEGRREATRRGLNVAGTLSVLDEADRAGLVTFDTAVAELQMTSFRISARVLSEIRQRRSLRP